MLLENCPYPQDVRVRDEAEALARAGQQVTVFAPRTSGQRRTEVVRGVRVRRYLLPGRSDSFCGIILEYLVAHAQLFYATARDLLAGTDVLHIHNPPDTLFLFGMLARALGRDVVYDHHDTAPELFEQKFGKSPLLPLLRALQRASFRTASAVIVTNESQRQIALANGGRCLSRIAVVRNGPHKHALLPDATGRSGKLRNPELVYVGTLASQDGVDQLPRLLANPALAGARLTIVGDGPRRKALAAECVAAGVADRVTFTGWVHHDRVAGFVAAADIAIDPAPCNALNHSSTMIKVAEYMAAGRPVVAYALTETIRTASDAALYARCGDTEGFAQLILRLADDPSQRRDLEQKALARATDLLWEHSEKVLLEVYNELGSRHAR